LFVAFVTIVSIAAPAWADDAPRFDVPKDKAAWLAQRDSVRKTLLEVLGDLPPRSSVPQVERIGGETRDGYTMELFRFDNGAGARVPGILLLPEGASKDHPAPGILYLHYYGPLGKDELLRPGPDGQPPGVGLVKKGYAVLCIDAYFAGERKGHGPGGPGERGPGAEEMSLFKTFLVEGKTLWGMMLRDDLMSLDYLCSRPEVDTKRIGATGMSMGATRCWWLMALDERIKCGVAVACLPRFSDLLATKTPRAHALYLWVPGLLHHFDTEAVLALCAPRPLATMVGDRDPTSPVSGVYRLENITEKVYDLYGKKGEFVHTLFGGLDHRYTSLEWDMMLEFFDHRFMPQGPSPLGHSPETEPTVDDRFQNLAEHGLAGWVPEMSQRPGTWTWHDGVISCKPGHNEYGWLRAPIEVEDFILSVEWKVPRGGNTGIFLRAKPVPWLIPPSEQGKLQVATLGLDWPSRTGLELQATDDHGKADKYSSGSLYRHAAPESNPTRPHGEWNRYTVRCRGYRVEVWVNGEQVLDTRIDRYDTLRHPPLKGYFGLQNHGVGAEFRNVRYLRVDPGSSERTSR
jgi:dienelactone hydrolase